MRVAPADRSAAHAARVRRKIGVRRLVAAVVVKLVIEHHVRARCPRQHRTLNHERRLLLHRPAQRSFIRHVPRPRRTRIIVPYRYAAFVEPDRTVQPVFAQSLPRPRHHPSTAASIGVVMHRHDVHEPVVRLTHRVLRDDRQRPRQPVVRVGVDVCQPAEHHLCAGVCLMRRQISHFEQSGIFANAARPEHGQVGFVPRFPDGDAPTRLPPLLYRKRPARFVALHRRMDEARPRVRRIGRFARARFVRAITENRRMKPTNACPFAVLRRNSQQNRVNAQAMFQICLYQPIIL